MANWQEGFYNSDYVVHLKGLIGQLKFEATYEPARLEEICVERYDNGDINILFTIHKDATNDSKQGGVHARLAHNSLFQDLHVMANRTDLEFSTSNQEVHKLSGRRGMERLLVQVLLRLEEYDNTLSEIAKVLHSFVLPTGDSVALVRDAVESQKSRLELLRKVLAMEESTMVAKKRRKPTKGKARAKKRSSR